MLAQQGKRSERTRDGIVRDRRPVDAELDARVGARVRTRERHRRGRLRTRPARDVNLRALHVELRPWVTRSSVQSCSSSAARQ